MACALQIHASIWYGILLGVIVTRRWDQCIVMRLWLQTTNSMQHLRRPYTKISHFSCVCGIHHSVFYHLPFSRFTNFKQCFVHVQIILVTWFISYDFAHEFAAECLCMSISLCRDRFHLCFLIFLKQTNISPPLRESWKAEVVLR
jgi:hypothetical protein